MPRPSIDLSLFRDTITEWARTNIIYQEIAEKLLNNWGISVDKRTIERRLYQ
jgi:hypothetical protein